MKGFKFYVSVICFMVFSTQSMQAQCFITTENGRMYFSEMKNLIAAKDRIVVNSGNLDVNIRMRDFMLVEYLENGIEIVQKDKIMAIDPSPMMAMAFCD